MYHLAKMDFYFYPILPTINSAIRLKILPSARLKSWGHVSNLQYNMLSNTLKPKKQTVARHHSINISRSNTTHTIRKHTPIEFPIRQYLHKQRGQSKGGNKLQLSIYLFQFLFVQAYKDGYSQQMIAKVLGISQQEAFAVIKQVMSCCNC